MKQTGMDDHNDFKIFQCHYPMHYHAVLTANQTPLLTTQKNHMVLVSVQQ